MFYCSLCLQRDKPRLSKLEEIDYDPFARDEPGYKCPYCENDIYTEEVMDVKEIEEYLVEEKLRLHKLERLLNLRGL